LGKVYQQSIALTETKNIPKISNFLNTIKGNRSKNSANMYHYGLAYFQTFLNEKRGSGIESILDPLRKERIDRYELIQEFINYLNRRKLSPKSVKSYLTGVRVFLRTQRIYLPSHEYKNQVKEPKILRNNKEPLDIADIQKILLNCESKRLKAFLFIIASGGTRAGETLSIRLKDIDFESNPTKINLRAQFTKTGKERYFFISDEATTYLQHWISHKYRKRDKPEYNKIRNDTDHVFAIRDMADPSLELLYQAVNEEFNKLLQTLKMDKRSEGNGRRTIKFHDFRTFVYSQISDMDSSFAEWLLGHEHSTYWSKRDEVKKQKYLEFQKYLRYIEPLQKLGGDVESKLKEKDLQIELLNRKIAQLETTIENSIDTHFKRMEEEHKRRIRQQELEKERFFERIRVRQAAEKKNRKSF
jgi:integrase